MEIFQLSTLTVAFYDTASASDTLSLLYAIEGAFAHG